MYKTYRERDLKAVNLTTDHSSSDSGSNLSGTATAGVRIHLSEREGSVLARVALEWPRAPSWASLPEVPPEIRPSGLQ